MVERLKMNSAKYNVYENDGDGKNYQGQVTLSECDQRSSLTPNMTTERRKAIVVFSLLILTTVTAFTAIFVLHFNFQEAWYRERMDLNASFQKLREKNSKEFAKSLRQFNATVQGLKDENDRSMHFSTRAYIVASRIKMQQNCATSLSKIPRLLLFDIDGTLVTSHYKDPVMSHPVATALSEAFEKDIRRNNIKFAGGTDRSIMRELLSAHGITESNTPDYEKCVLKALQILPAHMRRGVKEGQNWWSSLPGVHELLRRLSKLQNVRLGLLTGNIVEDARIKLESASVDVSLFEMIDPTGSKALLGAFGDDHEIRSQLVPFAQRRYADLLGQPVSPGDMVIIGDTPKDITCAHDNDVACVAVGTGPCSVDSLSDADFLLKDGFVDIDQSIKAIIETQKK